MSDQQKISLALIASALLHVLAGAFLIVWTELHPLDFAKPETEAEPEPLEVMLVHDAITVVATPTPAHVPAKTFTPVIDSDSLQPSEKAPEKAMFESDVNSRAASKSASAGAVPLPSQQGKTRPDAEFTTHDYSLGKNAQPALAMAKETPAATPEQTPAGVTEVQKTVPAPSPMNQTHSDESTPHPTPLFTPTPIPSPTPQPTPTPPDALALMTPTPVPSTPTPVEVARLMPTPALRARTEAQPPQPEPGYQPQREQTKIDGNITVRGKPGVDAVASPLGRYSQTVRTAVGSRWYWYVSKQMDLFSVGDVAVKFSIDPEGHVLDPKIISNTANETFGSYCIRAVTEAKIPPLPPDVAPALVNGRLEITYHFNLYSK